MRKQVCDLSVKLRHLSAQNSKAVDKLQDLRQDHRKLKYQSSVTDRELALCLKSMERLTWENDSLKRNSDSQKLYMKRIEHELNLFRIAKKNASREKSASYSQLNDAMKTENNKANKESSLKEQVKSLQQDLVDNETNFLEERRKREAAEYEIGIVQRAMRIQVNFCQHFALIRRK